MATSLQPQLVEDKEEKENQEAKGLKIAEADSRGEHLTVAMLSVPFVVDRIGFYLGDQCVQLSCLSKTIEATGHG